MKTIVALGLKLVSIIFAEKLPASKAEKVETAKKSLVTLAITGYLFALISSTLVTYSCKDFVAIEDYERCMEVSSEAIVDTFEEFSYDF